MVPGTSQDTIHGQPEQERKSWATTNTVKPTDPLKPSGLLGPVTIKAVGQY
jgi:hypothetical protein